jgi:quercetin dioxygenase-like cupin family protein
MRTKGSCEHTALFDALVTVLDGECEVWIAGKISPMRAGETIIFPAGVPPRALRDL